jgi:hypothetical protein
MPNRNNGSLFSLISAKKLTNIIVRRFISAIGKSEVSQIGIKNAPEKKPDDSRSAFPEPGILRPILIWYERIHVFNLNKLKGPIVAFILFFIALTALCLPAFGLLVLVFMLPPLMASGVFGKNPEDSADSIPTMIQADSDGIVRNISQPDLSVAPSELKPTSFCQENGPNFKE